MNKKRIIRARDVMKDNFVELDGMVTVKDTIHIIRTSSANVVIVKKRNENDVYGMVLLSDISKRVLAKDRAPARVNLYEIMTKPLISLPPDMDVRYCARLFNKFNLSVAPVIENEKILGIVSYGELVLHGLFTLYDEE